MEYEIVQDISLAEKKEEVNDKQETEVKDEIKPSVVIGEEKPVEETPVEETPTEETPAEESSVEMAPAVAPIDIGSILGDSNITPSEEPTKATVDIPVPEIEQTQEPVVSSQNYTDYSSYNEPYNNSYNTFDNNAGYEQYSNQDYQSDNVYSMPIESQTENVLSFDSEDSINAYYDRKIAEDTERTNKEREAALISYREKKDMEAWIAETENRFTYRPNRPKNYTDSNISQGYNMAA